MVELGEVQAQHADPHVLMLDPESRSKFNSHGTSLWNIVQKHPDCFMDTPSSESSSASNRMEHHRGAASGYIRSLSCRLILISKWTTRSKKTMLTISKDDLVLNEEGEGNDKDGGIDMDPCQTALNTSQLIRVQEQQLGETVTRRGVGSRSETRQGRLIPIALSSELEFALKCFTRAGRAMVGHGMMVELDLDRDTDGKTTPTARVVSPSVVTTETAAAAAAFDTLSLAVCAWEGLNICHEESDNKHENRKRINGSRSSMSMSTIDRARSEVFDALLLLPDCASKMKMAGFDVDVDTIAVAGKSSGDNSDKDGNDSDNEEQEMCPRRKYSQNSVTVISQLKLLQEFVRKQLGSTALNSRTCTSAQSRKMDDGASSNEHSSVVVSSQNIYAIQTYLPSLARISYKVSFEGET